MLCSILERRTAGGSEAVTACSLSWTEDGLAFCPSALGERGFLVVGVSVVRVSAACIARYWPAYAPSEMERRHDSTVGIG